MVVVVETYTVLAIRLTASPGVSNISRCFQSSGDSPHSFEQALPACFILEVG